MSAPTSLKACSLLLLIAFVASGCARREAEEDAAEPATSAAADTPAVPEPPKEVVAVSVDVSLSPAAEQRLKSLGEKVHVEIIYGGDAAPDTTLEPNELGMIELGRKVLDLDGSGTVNLPDSEVDRSRLDQIVGQPQILVNTTSAKTKTPENLLACSFYWDTLSTAGQDGVKINCSLLSEAGGSQG